jgi:hypothetical protein
MQNNLALIPIGLVLGVVLAWLFDTGWYAPVGVFAGLCIAGFLLLRGREENRR